MRNLGQLGAQRRHDIVIPWLENQRPGAGIAQQLQDFGRRKPEIQRNQYGRAVIGRRIRLVVFEAVGRKDCDALLSPQPERMPCGSEPAGSHGVLRMRQSPAVTDERLTLREASRIAFEKISERVHRPRLPCPNLRSARAVDGR